MCVSLLSAPGRPNRRLTSVDETGGGTFPELITLETRFGDFSLIEVLQWPGAVADLKPESADQAIIAETFKAEARHAGLRSPYRITPVRD
jgi:hypothetical protein